MKNLDVPFIFILDPANGPSGPAYCVGLGFQSWPPALSVSFWSWLVRLVGGGLLIVWTLLEGLVTGTRVPLCVALMADSGCTVPGGAGEL